jgi:hypothetical protein
MVLIEKLKIQYRTRGETKKVGVTNLFKGQKKFHRILTWMTSAFVILKGNLKLSNMTFYLLKDSCF